MSTRFEAANNERAQVTVPTQTGITLAGFVCPESTPAGGAFHPIVALYGAFQGWWLGYNSSRQLVIFDENPVAFDANTGSTVLSLGTHHYFWITMASEFAQLNVYLNGSTTPELTSNGNLAIDTPTMTLQFASSDAGNGTSYDGDISLCGWKMWAIERAASNAAAEMASHALVNATSAIGAWEFNGITITDSSGNGRHLSATGTLSVGTPSALDGGGGGGSATAPDSPIVVIDHPYPVRRPGIDQYVIQSYAKFAVTPAASISPRVTTRIVDSPVRNPQNQYTDYYQAQIVTGAVAEEVTFIIPRYNVLVEDHPTPDRRIINDPRYHGAQITVAKSSYTPPPAVKPVVTVFNAESYGERYRYQDQVRANYYGVTVKKAAFSYTPVFVPETYVESIDIISSL